MPDKPKRGLTVKQWEAVREAYESGESISSISKRTGATRETIGNRRDRETWVIRQGARQVSVGLSDMSAIRRRAQNNVVDIASRRSVERAQQDGTIDAVAEQLKTGLLLHAELEMLALAFAKDTIQKATSGKLRPGAHTSEANERKDALTVLEAAIRLSREIAGKRTGTPSIATEAEADTTRIVWEDTDAETA